MSTYNILLASKPRTVSRRTERMLQRNKWYGVHWSTHPQREQNETEKCSQSVDWQQNGERCSPAKLDYKLLKNVQDIRQVIKITRKTMKNWRVELIAGGKTLTEWEIQRSIVKENSPSSLLLVIAMMPLNDILRKCIGGCKFTKPQEKINHLMDIDDIKLFAKNEKLFIFTNPSARAGYDTGPIFLKRSLTGLNSEFFSCLTKSEEPSLSYYLPIAGGWIIGFIPFPRVLVLCEMQSVSSRIWTRVTVSISKNDNYYTMGTSEKIKNYKR